MESLNSNVLASERCLMMMPKKCHAVNKWTIGIWAGIDSPCLPVNVLINLSYHPAPWQGLPQLHCGWDEVQQDFRAKSYWLTQTEDCLWSYLGLPGEKESLEDKSNMEHSRKHRQNPTKAWPCWLSSFQLFSEKNLKTSQNPLPLLHGFSCMTLQDTGTCSH